jgi:hypothetical protein
MLNRRYNVLVLLTLPILLSCYSSQKCPNFVSIRSWSRSSVPKGTVLITLVDETGRPIVGTEVLLQSLNKKHRLSSTSDGDGKVTFKTVEKDNGYKVMVSIWCKKKPIKVGSFVITDEERFELYISIPTETCPPLDPL